MEELKEIIDYKKNIYIKKTDFDECKWHWVKILFLTSRNIFSY